MTRIADRPNRLPWPPLIFGAAVLLAVIAARLEPLPGLPRLAHYIGWPIMLAGLALDLLAVRTMRRHRANIRPNRAATALVTEFPFSISRNPIYFGNAVALAGAALAFRDWWFLPADALAIVAVTYLAIRREEAHLAARFGPAWQAYAARVPRWLRLSP